MNIFHSRQSYFLLIHVLCFLFLILVYPFPLFGQEPKTGKKVILQLQWKHQFEFAGFYAAKEKGFYADAGLDVDILEYSEGKDITGSVLAGESTFGILYSTVIRERMEGKPVVLLANYFKRSPLAIAVKQDIYFPGDLKGKKVMGVEHEINSANFSMMFKQFNMTSDDFTVIPHTYSIDKFMNGEVDAMTVFLTNEVYNLRERKVPFNVIDPNNYGVPLYDVSVFTSESFAGESPEAVRSFIGASNKGWEYALKNKEEIVDLILSKYNTQHKTRGHLLYEADMTQRMVQAEIYPIGSIDTARIKRIGELFASEGVAKNIESLEGFVFGSMKPGAIDFTPQEQSFIQEHSTVRIVKSFHQPPFCVLQGDSVTGYLYDLLEQVLLIAGFKSKYVTGFDSYDAMVDSLQLGTADILPNINSSRQLPDIITRTIPVATTPNALIAKINTPLIKDTSDLFGKKVAVVKGYAQDHHLSRFPLIHKVHVGSNDEGFAAVRMGQADYFLNNLANSNYILQETFSTDLQISGQLSYTDFPPLVLSFGIRGEYQELPAIIKKSLAAVPLEIRSRLREKWFGKEGPGQNEIEESSGISLSTEEYEYLAGKESINLCSVSETAPLDWIDKDGLHQGIAADVMSLISERIGRKFNLVEIHEPNKPFSETDIVGNCDIVSSVSHEEAITGHFNLTEPYLELDVVIATRKERIYIRDISSLAGEKIGVVKNSVYQTNLEKSYPSVEIVAVNDLHEGLHMLQGGEIIGLVDNLISLAYAIQQSGLTDVKISGQLEAPILLSFGVRQDAPTLFQILNRALNSIPKQKRQEFANEWIAVKFEKGVDYTLLWQVLAVTTFVIIGIVYWNRKLTVINQKIIKTKEALENSKLEAEKANIAKSVFLANMSHELRTPLNAILGFSELMTRDATLSEEQLHHLGIIGRSGEHLLSLINDVLDFSKIEAGQAVLDKENFDLHQLLLGLEEMFRLRVKEKGLSLDVTKSAQVPQVVCTDQRKLRQILINLLGNGVKFTQTDGISLSVSVRESRNTTQPTQWLRFEVFDTGPGIQPEEKSKIFDAFFQGDHRPSNQQGTGLGLPISKKFAELMGGDLYVSSKSGVGSCFSFEIPLDISEHSDPITPDVKGKVLRVKPGQPEFRLLVVEDNEHSRVLLTTLLRSVGFIVREAVNGRECIDLWREWQPHLIWMDMRMPEMDGYEATEKIKAEIQEYSREPDTKIIALTASVFEADRLKVIQQGGDDFLRKPFKDNEIFEMLERHLGVCFEYGDGHGMENDKPIDYESIKSDLKSLIHALPQELIKTLQEAAELSDAVMIEQTIDQIRHKNTALADELSVPATRYEYEKILAIIRDAGSEDLSNG